MNDERDKSFVRRSVDEGLSSMQGDPWLARRIIASERGEPKVKKRSGAALALAVVMGLTMATALAAGISGIWRDLNWFGEEVRERTDSIPSSAPVGSVPTETASVDIDSIIQESVNSAEARELVVISDDTGVSYAARTQDVSSLEEFDALMQNARGIPTPEAVPEGYVFVGGHVEFGCLSEGKYVLTSRRIIAEGVTESRYSVDPSFDCILGYVLRFAREDREDDLSIVAHLQPSRDPQEDVIGVSDDQTAQAVRIDGMDNGIAVDSEAIHFLFMRKTMDEPISILIFGSDEHWIETCGECHIRVSSQRLDSDELIGIFA